MSLKREFSAEVGVAGSDELLLMEMTQTTCGLKLKQNNGLLRSHIHNQPRPNYITTGRPPHVDGKGSAQAAQSTRHLDGQSAQQLWAVRTRILL